jgi:hypothetical protein
MKRFMNKKVAAIGLAAGLVLGGAGAAFAYFTSTGNATGDASVGSATPWTVNVASDTSNALLPGSGTETLTYTITNASSGTQELNGVAVSVGNSGPAGACLGSWFTATDNGSTNGVTPGGVSADLAGGASDTGTITVSLNDSGTNQDACEGLTSVPVTVNAS